MDIGWVTNTTIGVKFIIEFSNKYDPGDTGKKLLQWIRRQIRVTGGKEKWKSRKRMWGRNFHEIWL